VQAAGVAMVWGTATGLIFRLPGPLPSFAAVATGVRMITAANFTDFMYRRAGRRSWIRRRAAACCSARRRTRWISCGYWRRAGAQRAGGRASLDPARRAEGAYTAVSDFEGGVAASLTYSGCAHFDSDEFCGWTGENGAPKDRATLRGHTTL